MENIVVKENDLDEFTTDELIDELEWRGEYSTKVDDFDDYELIDELQDRSYNVYGKLHEEHQDLFELYKTYQTMPNDFFMKELKKFFREKLDVSEY